MAPKFVRKPRSTEVVEGDSLVVVCEVIGDPKPEVRKKKRNNKNRQYPPPLFEI
jgi:hypothetical protein